MNNDDIIVRAQEFATKAHAEQRRKYEDLSYIVHPEAVAAFLDRQGEAAHVVAAAWLHDVLEDTYVTMDDLMTVFPANVCELVKLLTRTADENYFDYIRRLLDAHNPAALRIKLADLAHNMKSLHEGSLKDKYRFAEFVIKNTPASYVR